MKKSNKIHLLKVKCLSSVDKSTIEDLLKKDSTLKKEFDRVGNPIIRWKYVGEYEELITLPETSKTKTGRSFNQLVIPKRL